MTPANRTKIEKAARELLAAAKLKGTAQDKLLAIYRATDLLHAVSVDLIFRPEVNSESR